ncbi:hypothetical protein N8I84_39960 [Streptomyces cynarae]|uniref:Uncharacterized protein n=1 Tax=Streptomyces cynarae TaxID=2981134 RepID=A0ABY6EE61_9ACTN|nr:hypothetical protein [Streptomyces cynarae]UXY24173.1 hypothetical protein N8I84_39960 [Streptomyces cynarae]
MNLFREPFGAPMSPAAMGEVFLWLTPLTGVDPKTYAGVWPEVLDQADRVLRARLGKDAADGGDVTLQSIALMLAMAYRTAAAGDLYQATVPLAYCETPAQRLQSRPRRASRSSTIVVCSGVGDLASRSTAVASPTCSRCPLNPAWREVATGSDL